MCTCIDTSLGTVQKEEPQAVVPTPRTKVIAWCILHPIHAIATTLTIYSVIFPLLQGDDTTLLYTYD